MAKVGHSDLVNRFKKVSIDSLEFISPVQQLKQLLTQNNLEPEFNKPCDTDPNQIFVAPTQKMKKNLMHPVKGGEHAQKSHDNQNEEGHEERHRVYRPGPFALFYKLNEGKEDKDAEVWYYKHHKDIIGPVSSYNMDKMVYYKSVNDDTKVGYQSIDKFVKFKKIKSLVEAEQEQQEI